MFENRKYQLVGRSISTGDEYELHVYDRRQAEKTADFLNRTSNEMTFSVREVLQ